MIKILRVDFRDERMSLASPIVPATQRFQTRRLNAMNIESHDELDMVFDRQADDPTPDEIRLACLRIQATWSDEERRYRAGIRDVAWCSIA